MNALKKLAPAPLRCDGLSPGAMCPLREYVEAHLSERIQLVELAAVAGLSLYHFARWRIGWRIPHQLLPQIERSVVVPGL
jgi:hypothetical protein